MAIAIERDMSTSESFPCSFVDRHIGPRTKDISAMLKLLSVSSLDELSAKVVPEGIRLRKALDVQAALSEHEALSELSSILSKNRIFRSFIGMGFNDTVTPPVILRNILENPGWYTQYTPYQAEISQGRLEALINFQTMICDLTGMQISNASMLDEGSAAAEAMMMSYRAKGSDSKSKFFVASDCHPHVIDVVKTRANPLGVEVVVGEASQFSLAGDFFGTLLQYPNTKGEVIDYSQFVSTAHKNDALVVVSADILSLALLKPPGEWGADIVVGNSQRFGVPLGFGGPHAAFFATKDEFKRDMPGRLIGVSKDAAGKPAYRLALQTREQHIRRDKATSNICTAQVLLAVTASMYAVYHGPEGIKAIASKVSRQTAALREGLKRLGISAQNATAFDTLTINTQGSSKDIIDRARRAEINLRDFGTAVGVSLDETTTEQDIEDLLKVISGKSTLGFSVSDLRGASSLIPKSFERTSKYLTHKVFNSYRSETEMLRYMSKLQAKDLSLTTSMIPLGSCTMKLNATAEMIPVTWATVGKIHPFAPLDQALGYRELFTGLESALSQVTGFSGISLQPNAGSQGEYAGLLAIDAYHRSRGQGNRRVCLIPNSAHGTNPASAAMVGMEVVKVECDKNGNVDLTDLRARAEEHKANLSCVMITYPSTHGVFEEEIREICKIVHSCGGQVYMDGANMNAQVGLCRPADFGADVCHLNLHKTFCIPHGGGGPGVGPIGVAAHLKPFLPGHFHLAANTKDGVGPVTSAPWGSASILVIPWMYIRMMGADGLKLATQVAILNANYIAKRLENHFPVLYKGKNGFVAHECILDLRNFKPSIGIEVADVAKRLMDYGFHAPTVSFPVVETLMVEPTESESKEELDRFCDAMILIREEIREIEDGKVSAAQSVVKNSPHTADQIASSDWSFPYSREKAAFPAPWLKEHKYWPTVRRIDNVYGDRNLFCSCV